MVFALSPGCNISKLQNDSSETTNVLYPLIGISLNKEINKKIGIYSNVQFSFRGANHSSPAYKFRNSYIDLQLASQYTLNSYIKIQLGGQFSKLLNSKFLVPNYMYGTWGSSLKGKYNSQFEFFLGTEFLFQKSASLNLKYSLPLKSMEYTNFQISLNIFLRKEYFKRKDTSAENMFGMKIVKDGYVEDNGIIYPGTVSSPPQFRDGMVSMYQYFEDNVRIDPIINYSDYGSDDFPFLFELKIDTLGKVSVLGLAGSAPADQDPVFRQGHLPGEIKTAIEAMSLWSPALIDGKAAEIIFYLPLNIRVNMNKITILPSKYMVPYKNRESK